ncbi:helix-turn-helix domain-containing protein [Paenibacillus sp. strain BS8-2]
MISLLQHLLKKRRSKQYFYRLIGYGLVSVVVPIILISSISYNITISNMEKQNYQARMNMLGQLQSRVDERLESARKALYSLLFDADIARAAQASGRSLSSQQLIDAQEKLALLNQSIDGSFGVSVFFVDSNAVLFQDRYITKLNQEWITDYPKHVQVGEWQYQMGSNYRVVSYTIALPAFSKTPRAYLTVHINHSAFADILRDIDFIEWGDLYFLDAELQPILSSKQGDISESQAEKGMEWIEGNDRPFDSWKDKPSNLTALYIQSDKTSYYTALLLPLNTQGGFVADIIWITILISLLAIVTGGVILYVNSKRLYAPIYQWLKAENYTQEGQIENRDEWTWLRSRWQLLKEDLQKNEPVLRKSFLSALLGGYYSESKKDLPDLLNRRQITHNQKCVVFIVDAGEYLTYKSFKEEDEALVHAAISNIFEELIRPYHLEGDSFKRFEVNQSIFILYYPRDASDAQAQQMTKQITQALIMSIKTYLKFPATLGLGKIRQSVLELRDSYLEAIEALQYRIIREKDQIIDINDVIKVRDRFEYPFDISKKIVKELRSANRREVENSFNEFVDAIRLKTYSDQTYRQIFLMLYDAMIQGLNYFSYEAVNELLNKNGYEKILHAQSFTEIEQWFKQDWIISCFLLIERENESKGKQIIESAKQYIAMTLDQDHSLNLVAEQVNLNPSYFSRLFRKETGQNFLQYVSSIKADEAKKQLEQTDDPIYSIAEKVGYTEQTFRRVFKSQTGMSPNEYRKSLRS